MSGVTERLTVSGEDSSNLGATINCQPNDLIQVRASEFQAMLEQISQLKTENAAMQKTSAVLTTFTLFPKLPLELRLKVWKEALQVQEVFTFGYVKKKLRERRMYDSDFPDAQLLSGTSKSCLMQVNKEARTEGVTRLARFRYRGRSTWYNPDRDITYFPGFDIETSEMCDEGLLETPRIRIMAIPYRYWYSTKNYNMDCVYHEFYQFNISDLVLVLGPNDLRKKSGTETINATSMPADFVLREDQHTPTTDLSWEVLAKQEMLQMEAWKKTIEDKRDEIKREEGLTDEELDEDYTLWVHYAIPTITFRFQRDSLSLISP